MKIVVNRCHGGFGFNKKAEEMLGHDYSYYLKKRDDPKLISIVEQLGDAVNDSYSELEVVEIPDDVEWTIEEYDGQEWVAEKHRTW